jgi:ligand-binding SRPBCC domain-containing protein
MPRIKLTTKIKAPIKVVFDLSRSVDLHKLSTKHTNETAIGGVTKGLMELNDSVTWKARHFGIYQTLTSKITSMDRPNNFNDEMEKGAFNSFKHFHGFETDKSITTMTDVFDYKSPFGILGRLADRLFLEKYMTKLLVVRNQVIKEYAESEDWKDVL